MSTVQLHAAALDLARAYLDARLYSKGSRRLYLGGRHEIRAMNLAASLGDSWNIARVSLIYPAIER